MSIEAQALSKLILAIDEASGAFPHLTVNLIKRAIAQAKYWVQPLQAHMDFGYEWAASCDEGGRQGFLERLDTLPNKWVVRCVVIGNMNYSVENGGFLQWIDNGFASMRDIEILLETFEDGPKTPVHSQVYGILFGLVNFIIDSLQEEITTETRPAIVKDLKVFADAYLSLRYQFLAEVEQRIREDVPVFQP